MVINIVKILIAGIILAFAATSTAEVPIRYDMPTEICRDSLIILPAQTENIATIVDDFSILSAVIGDLSFRKGFSLPIGTYGIPKSANYRHNRFITETDANSRHLINKKHVNWHISAILSDSLLHVQYTPAYREPNSLIALSVEDNITLVFKLDESEDWRLEAIEYWAAKTESDALASVLDSIRPFLPPNVPKKVDISIGQNLTHRSDQEMLFAGLQHFLETENVSQPCFVTDAATLCEAYRAMVPIYFPHLSSSEEDIAWYSLRQPDYRPVYEFCKIRHPS